MSGSAITGGCQCGAVRFRLARFGGAAICHCRMCQKAFGGFFGPLVTAFDLEWTRGAPRYFASSDKARRGFCADCGTPLTYEAGGEAEVAIGALDRPQAAPPVMQVNPKDKLAFFDGLCALPTRQPDAKPQQEAFKASLRNLQHPDHDTAEWPAKAER
ncbi:MAG: GFA family protein [Proteobacteria bacterium]|nr:GFA family protein [Pseudomonadota bacterium]